MFVIFYHKIPRRFRILILFLLIILTTYFVVRFLTPNPKIIPDEFLKARQEASLIAKEIIAVSVGINENLNKVSELDSQKKYSEALVIISAERERNWLAREKAINLSVKLAAMAENISAIEPSSAGQVALQAVSLETALISRLINYNDYLNQLFEILREKFLDPQASDTDGKILELIGKINEEARIINELDGNFNELMAKFDKI
ncbi:MAG: hypothetical protein AAB464_00080 [Patescibacteria group bacterium]